MKKKFNNNRKKIRKYLKIINQIEKIRSINNINWMNILRIAIKNSPGETIKIMTRVNSRDKKISELFEKLRNEK